MSVNFSMQSSALKFELPEPETPLKKSVRMKGKRASRMVVDHAIEIESAQMKVLLSREGKDALNLVPYTDEYLTDPYPAGRVSAL
jgi:hypothetical protein